MAKRKNDKRIVRATPGSGRVVFSNHRVLQLEEGSIKANRSALVDQNEFVNRSKTKKVKIKYTKEIKVKESKPKGAKPKVKKVAAVKTKPNKVAKKKVAAVKTKPMKVAKKKVVSKETKLSKLERRFQKEKAELSLLEKKHKKALRGVVESKLKDTREFAINDSVRDFDELRREKTSITRKLKSLTRKRRNLKQTIETIKEQMDEKVGIETEKFQKYYQVHGVRNQIHSSLFSSSSSSSRAPLTGFEHIVVLLWENVKKADKKKIKISKKLKKSSIFTAKEVKKSEAFLEKERIENEKSLRRIEEARLQLFENRDRKIEALKIAAEERKSKIKEEISETQTIRIEQTIAKEINALSLPLEKIDFTEINSELSNKQEVYQSLKNQLKDLEKKYKDAIDTFEEKVTIEVRKAKSIYEAEKAKAINEVESISSEEVASRVDDISLDSKSEKKVARNERDIEIIDAHIETTNKRIDEIANEANELKDQLIKLQSDAIFSVQRRQEENKNASLNNTVELSIIEQIVK